MKTIKITKGNDFVIYLPLVLLNTSGEEAADTSKMTSVSVKVKRACAQAQTITPSYVQNYMVLSFPETMAVGAYDCDITFKYDGVDKSLQINQLFEIVEFDKQSNWQDYIVGDHIVTDTQAFIAGAYLTDADYTRLKAELAVKIAAAEAAKAEYEAKVAELTDVAKQTTSTAIKTETDKIGTASAGKPQTVFGAIEGIELDKSDLAKVGSDPTATMTALKTAIAAIPTTQITGYALQGSNANATNTAILAAIPSEEVMKNLYAARAEANQDGTDTYTIVFPYTAQVTETATDIEITI